jgi:hypothetical protein
MNDTDAVMDGNDDTPLTAAAEIPWEPEPEPEPEQYTSYEPEVCNLLYID